MTNNKLVNKINDFAKILNNKQFHNWYISLSLKKIFY